MKQKKIPLSLQIFLALGLGIAVGMAFTGNPAFAVSYIKPFGTIYLNLIKMIVVPVVVLSIIQGIVSLQDVRKVGSIGIKTIAFYLVTTAIAVTLGLVAANLLQVGAGYTLGTEALTYEPAEPLNLMDTLVNIFPSNACHHAPGHRHRTVLWLWHHRGRGKGGARQECGGQLRRGLL